MSRSNIHGPSPHEKENDDTPVIKYVQTVRIEDISMYIPWAPEVKGGNLKKVRATRNKHNLKIFEPYPIPATKLHRNLF